MLATATAFLLGNDDAPPARGFEPGDAYVRLRDAPFSTDVVPEGFGFRGVRGTLPVAEANARKGWVVYAEFDSDFDRARVAFQVFETAARAREFVAERFGAACRTDRITWECAAAHGPVALKGEILCLKWTRRCVAGRDDAARLLRAGRRHLESLGLAAP